MHDLITPSTQTPNLSGWKQDFVCFFFYADQVQNPLMDYNEIDNTLTN